MKIPLFNLYHSLKCRSAIWCRWFTQTAGASKEMAKKTSAAKRRLCIKLADYITMRLVCEMGEYWAICINAPNDLPTWSTSAHWWTRSAHQKCPLRQNKDECAICPRRTEPNIFHLRFTFSPFVVPNPLLSPFPVIFKSDRCPSSCVCSFYFRLRSHLHRFSIPDGTFLAVDLILLLRSFVCAALRCAAAITRTTTTKSVLFGRLK